MNQKFEICKKIYRIDQGNIKKPVRQSNGYVGEEWYKEFPIDLIAEDGEGYGHFKILYTILLQHSHLIVEQAF